MAAHCSPTADGPRSRGRSSSEAATPGRSKRSCWAEELNRFELPANVFTIGIAMIGPTIIAHGTPEQHERYLRPMLEGREVWCQLWSEPGAGSDLAGLSSQGRARRRHYVLNGQKVWTSGAHYSDFGLGLFRSDPTAPKHHGITALIVDMRSPGIDIRPLRQITGDAHFNEVFFDDVRVPVENRVGEENDGWRVGRTTMMNERYAAGAMGSALGPVPRARRTSRPRRARRGPPRPPSARPRVHVVAAVRPHHRAGAHEPRQGHDPRRRGLDPQARGRAARHGASPTRAATCSVPQVSSPVSDGPEAGRWPAALLGSIAMHIGGGTDEIQRNIIGEVVLGLPAEPAVSS